MVAARPHALAEKRSPKVELQHRLSWGVHGQEMAARTRLEAAMNSRIRGACRTKEARLKEGKEGKGSFHIDGCVQRVFLRPAQEETVIQQKMEESRDLVSPQVVIGCRGLAAGQLDRRRTPS